MKNLFIIPMLLILITCKAQSPIVNIANKHSTEEGVYNKDVNNLLNAFEGDYLYTNGTTSLQIILKKKVMQFNGKYYEDLIVGEYEYKVGGVTQISTLANIDVVYPNQKGTGHGIAGNSLLKKTNRPICNECTTNEKRLRLGFDDPTTTVYGNILIQKIVHLGQPAIKVIIYAEGGSYLVGTSPPADMKVPLGEYILIKQ